MLSRGAHLRASITCYFLSGARRKTMTLLDILAVLLTLSALFGSLNETQLRLPYTVGLVAIALVASLAVVLAQTQSHTDARRPPCSCGRWQTSTFAGAAPSAIFRTSEHFHVFSPAPRLSVRMFGSGGKKRANA